MQCFFPWVFANQIKKADFMNNEYAQCVCFLVATEEDDDDGFSMHIFPPPLSQIEMLQCQVVISRRLQKTPDYHALKNSYCVTPKFLNFGQVF